ncbi:MAG: ROK family transcriptional regulator [Anaerolineales bacterium]|nr:ROK family transcriptional regulator [Anaerolineales bacterium]
MAIQTTADQGFIRKLNTAVILDYLRRFAPLSRAELAARAGLNRSTVSIIINSLIEEGFIQETDLQNAKVGRPGMLLTLNPKGGFAVGVEIGVDFISVILTDFVANVLWQERVVSDPAEDQIHILDGASELTQKAIDMGTEQGLRPLGIGIGVPGLVDLRQGKLVFAPNLKWSNVPLRLMWSQRFELPIFIENEANAAALGEYYFGVARGKDSFIYLSAGIGLGGGVIIDGKLFRGSSGYAGEIGHMTIDPDGELCGCGKRGCWETKVGPRAVLRRVRKILTDGTPSLINELSGGNLDGISFNNVVDAANMGDTVAVEALKDVGKYLGIGVINLINIFNPELIVLGGALSLAHEYLLPVIKEMVRESSLTPPCEHIEFAASGHGSDACVMGAVALVLDDILREPTSLQHIT